MKILISMMLLVSNANAGIKDQFIESVVKQCGKSEAEAKQLATPGRAGNVVKLKLCPSNPFPVSSDCKIKCLKKGTVVGN